MAVLFAAIALPAAARERESFDFGWRFHLGDTPGAQAAGFDASAWRALDLPHDWSIEGPYDEAAPAGGTGGYLPTGIGWYRKSFATPQTAGSQRVFIQFDGVYEKGTVWINGHELGTRPYGYSSFHYDITPFLSHGSDPNIVAVRVDNSQQPNSRWYSGSGIYRHTWLLVTDPLHVVTSGITVRTPEVSAAAATVTVSATLRNGRKGAEMVVVRNTILPAGAAPTAPAAASLSDESQPAECAPGAERAFDATLQVPSPSLWSPESPNLYEVRTDVLVGGVVVDSVVTRFGIRSLSYDVDRGLLINGKQVKLRGMCLHHDGGAVGAAVPEAVLERRLRLLQEMGCNAIRCSHNPEAPEFYEICDRLGLLVLDEAFDEWTNRKPQIKFGYSDMFAEWHLRDLRDFIRRDRNHPCVVMWCAGNEVGEQEAPDGASVLAQLVDVFHKEDPTRPVTVAMDNIFNQSGPAPEAFTSLLDVVGYNYVDRWGSRRETQYSDDRHAHPGWKFLGTEETGIPTSRGEYEFGSLLGDNDSDDHLVLGNGPVGPLYVASTIRASRLWEFAATRDYVIGQFTWTGVDYLGESKWPMKATSFGALDTCGFKKDSYYYFKSLWTTEPMIHLLPHWNWPDRVGKVIPVVAYTNCSAVELFLNGQSLGVKSREFPSEGVSEAWNHYDEPKVEATTSDLQLAWDVRYEPGELMAVGYDRAGAIVARDVVRTAREASRLEVTSDRAALAAGRDVASIEVRAVDADGNLVPMASNRITFSVSGPAKIIGVDNGDPASHASYQGDERDLFHGMALALVQTSPTAGRIKVSARAEGLPEASVELTSRQGE
ncbi:MAG TPA: glycoside hydrolase family 2 TIM barrel-domain containing protein [Opitutaceae bacterium]